MLFNNARRYARLKWRLEMLDKHVADLQAADEAIKEAVGGVNTRVTAILAKLTTAIDQEDEDAIDAVKSDLTDLKGKLDAIAPADPTPAGDQSGEQQAAA